MRRAGSSKVFSVPRLRLKDGITLMPAFTDLKLHDITSKPDDPNREPLDMQEATLAHAGEAQEVTDRLKALTAHEQDSVIDFLKTAGAAARDHFADRGEHGNPRMAEPLRPPFSVEQVSIR
jgi:hypothetical protein